jgi:large subunit ribosomal protein L4
MYRAGLCSILSQLAREGRLSVIEEISLEAPKTKLLSSKLKEMGLLESVLIIADNIDENLALASRNLPHVLIVEPRHADPVSLVFYKKIVITKAALAKIEEMLA